MTTNPEHKYSAEALLQAVIEARDGNKCPASSRYTTLDWIETRARELDAARPKPAHTDVAAKLAEALRDL